MSIEIGEKKLQILEDLYAGLHGNWFGKFLLPDSHSSKTSVFDSSSYPMSDHTHLFFLSRSRHKTMMIMFSQMYPGSEVPKCAHSPRKAGERPGLRSLVLWTAFQTAGALIQGISNVRLSLILEILIIAHCYFSKKMYGKLQKFEIWNLPCSTRCFSEIECVITVQVGLQLAKLTNTRNSILMPLTFSKSLAHASYTPCSSSNVVFESQKLALGWPTCFLVVSVIFYSRTMCAERCVVWESMLLLCQNRTRPYLIHWSQPTCFARLVRLTTVGYLQ